MFASTVPRVSSYPNGFAGPKGKLIAEGNNMSGAYDFVPQIEDDLAVARNSTHAMLLVSAV